LSRNVGLGPEQMLNDVTRSLPSRPTESHECVERITAEDSLSAWVSADDCFCYDIKMPELLED